MFKPCCIALSLIVQRDPVVGPLIFAMLITQDATLEKVQASTGVGWVVYHVGHIYWSDPHSVVISPVLPEQDLSFLAKPAHGGQKVSWQSLSRRHNGLSRICLCVTRAQVISRLSVCRR